jgi:hypothetical protein
MISEFMASNDTILADEDGDYADWIELYNGDIAEVNLTGWYLTDDPANLIKWQLPDVTLAADSYLIVFASGKNRTPPQSSPTSPPGGTEGREIGSELHTQFKLSSNGEYLALVEPDGTTIAWDYKPQFPPQFTDLSYGLDGTVNPNERYFTAPTPGAANGTGAADQGPIILDAHHTPTLPDDDDELIITATIKMASSPMMSTTLHYRVMFSETMLVTMFDDGAHSDGAAGDEVYGASIPSAASEAGEMVRYYITAEDNDGNGSRWPFFVHATKSAEYLGTMITNPSLTSTLPILHWFVEDSAAAQTPDGTRASVFYHDGAVEGRLYDNIFVRTRGTSAEAWPKKSFKFDFNAGDYFDFSPDYAPVEEFNLNSTYSDKAYIRQPLAWDTYRQAGSPYALSYPMRVQQNGEFYSVAMFVEQVDELYLARQGFSPEGALYKMYNALDNAETSATEEVKKITRLGEDNSDLQALVDAIHDSDPQVTVNYLYDHLNIPAFINYLAATVIMHDLDAGKKNYYLYRDTEGNKEWYVFPWDKDLTFGRNWIKEEGILNDVILADDDSESYPISLDWNRLMKVINGDAANNPVMQEMYLRRLRTLMDDVLQHPDTAANDLKYEQYIDGLTSQMAPDVALDAANWSFEWGEPQSFSEAINIIKNNYLAVRRTHLYLTHGPPNEGIIPDAQDIAIIEFGTLEANPSSGKQNEEYFTLVNPNNVAVDISGWTIANDIQYTFQPGVVIPAGGTLYLSPNVVTFRNRASSPTGGEGNFVQGDYQGQLSNTGGTVELYNAEGLPIDELTFEPGDPSPLAGALIISELNYHPLGEGNIDGDDFEFIEFKNIGSSTLDLSGIHFTDGITYTMMTTLAPRELLVLIRDESAFSQRCPNVTAAGLYEGGLSNRGEDITLSDKNGLIISSFEYDDKSPWPEAPDGDGYTLVRKTPPGAPNAPLNWRASTNIYGSPCADVRKAHVRSTPDGNDSCEGSSSNTLYLPLVGK